jgi:hypothetical protein
VTCAEYLQQLIRFTFSPEKRDLVNVIPAVSDPNTGRSLSVNHETHSFSDEVAEITAFFYYTHSSCSCFLILSKISQEVLHGISVRQMYACGCVCVFRDKLSES